MKSLLLFLLGTILIVNHALAQSSWTPVWGGPVGADIARIRSDAAGNLYAYASSDGRLYKSTDNGSTWRAISSAGYNEDFEIDGSKLILLSWSEFHSSIDGGATWTKVNSSTDGIFSNGQKLGIIPGVNGYLIAGDQSASISLDGGVSWKLIYNGNARTFAFSSAGDIYIADPDKGIVKHPTQSSSTGWDLSKWVTIFPKELSNADALLTVGVNRGANDKVYITYRNNDNTDVLMKSSTDGGALWTTVRPPLQNMDNIHWFFFSTDNKFYLLAGRSIYNVTGDLTPIFTLNNFPGYSSNYLGTFYYKSSAEIYAGVASDGLWKSNDGMLTWFDSSGIPPNALFLPDGIDVEMVGQNIIFLTDYNSNGYWYSPDNGNTFLRKQLSMAILGFNQGKSFKRLQNNSVLANTTSGPHTTTDGINWVQVSSSLFSDYAVVGASDIYGFADDGIIKKSTITNLIPSAFDMPVLQTGLPASYKVMMAIYGIGYFYLVIQNNSVTPSALQYWRLNSATSPMTATQMNVSLDSSPNSNAGMFFMNNKLYIGDHQNVAISSNQGATFSYLNYPHRHILPITQNGGGLGVSDAGKFVTTKDDGKTWLSIKVPNVSTINSVYVASSGLAFAAGYGAPLLKSDSVVRKSAQTYIDFGWTKLNGPYGGGGRKLFMNPSGQLFADGFNSVHRYNTTLSSWETLENVSMENYGFFIDSNGVIYQSTWGDLYKSTDNGDTFIHLSTRNIGLNNGGLFKDASLNIYALTGVGLFRSSDDGITFSKPVNASSGSYFEMVQSGNTLLTVKLDQGAMILQRSADSGQTWTQVTGVTFPNAARRSLILSASPNALLVTTSDNIYKSIDGGISWVTIKSNITEADFTTFGSFTTVAPNGDYFFYLVGYPGKIYVSTDQGVTWALRANSSSNQLHDIRSLLWVGSRIFSYSVFDGISYSDDSGITFNNFQNNKGLTNYYGDVLALDNKLFFTAAGDGILKSDDQGDNWNQIYSSFVNNFLPLKNGDLISYGSVIAKSIDRGATWTTINSTNSCCNYFSYLVQTSNSYLAFGTVSNLENRFWTSSDLSTWTEQVVTGLPLNGIQSMAALADQVFVRGYNNKSDAPEVYKISVGNATQITVSNNPGKVVSYNGKVFIFNGEGNLYESTDGTNWNRIAVPRGDNFIVSNNGYLFITDVKGVVWLSRDNGGSWQNVNATNFGAEFTAISLDMSTGYAYGTAKQRGVLKSAQIVIPDDKTGPVASSFTPSNSAIDIPITNLKLSIVLTKFSKRVNGKKIRIYNSSQPSTPLQTMDASEGVTFGNTITFAPTFSVSYQTSYFVAIDNGAFTDLFGNGFAGITNQTTWRFTTVAEPDTHAPVITFTKSNLEKGIIKNIEVQVTDDKSITENKIKLFYRGISSLDNTTFQSTNLTVNTGAGTLNVKAGLTASESWYDGMGLEFYFEAEDNAGNKVRSPAATTDFYYSYITYPPADRKILGLVPGGINTTYRIISIPYHLEDFKVETQFDELLPLDNTKWRLLTYAGNDTWNDFAKGDFTNFERGKGYWINIKNLSEIFLDGASSPENNRTSFYTILLKQGWNQIGNPYPVSVSWNEAIAGLQGVSSIKLYKSGWSDGDVMGPYEGGFVYAANDQPVKVRFQGITSGGRMEDAKKIKLPDWELPVSITQNNMKNELSGIGMHQDASNGFDRHDELILPPFSQLHDPQIIFNQTKFDLRLSKDIVEIQDQYVWKFSVASTENGIAELNWKSDELTSWVKDIFLLDEQMQVLVNMKEIGHYQFYPSESKLFQIHFGNDLKNKIKPSANVIGKIYPNPSQRQIYVPVAIEEGVIESQVTLEIYDRTGRIVHFMRSNPLNAGFYTLETQLDENLSNGVYFLKTTVHSEMKAQVKTSKLILIR